MSAERSLFSGVLAPEMAPSVPMSHAAQGEDVPVTESMLGEIHQKLTELSAEIRTEAGPPGTNQTVLAEKRQEWINLLRLYERLDDTLDAQASRRRGTPPPADMPLVGTRIANRASGDENGI